MKITNIQKIKKYTEKEMRKESKPCVLGFLEKTEPVCRYR